MRIKRIGITLGVALTSILFFSNSASAASNLSVSNSGKVSFGKVQPSSTGTLVTGEDTLSISTDCSAGTNVYATSVNGGSTSLVNPAANSNNTIATSSNAIGSAGSLENNTWGLNTVNDNTFYGLPAYSDSSLSSAIYSGTNIEVPVYYGAKVTNTLALGTYTGQVLYTVTINSSCLAYTVNFDKNANDATGTMSPQEILVSISTPLSKNTFTRSGWEFLGWNTDPAATTALYTDEESVSSLAPADGEITLYAIWKDNRTYFQTFNSCSAVPEGETGTLTDSRDGQEYTVYHIPSNATYPGTSTVANVAGKCIMTKDLNLGAVASVEGSASTIVANGAMTLSPEDSNFTTPTGSGESITVPTASVSITNGTGSWDTSTNSYSNKQYTTSGTGSYANRGYYSWGAAMTVCPKGWRLPTPDEYNNNDSSYNASTTGISKLVNNNISTIQSSPWSINLGGNYSGSFSGAGSYGYYWSSAQNSSTHSYTLYLGSSNGLAQYSNNKYNGFSVRCIAEVVDGTMQSFDTSSLAIGETAKLADERDGSVYTVKKFGSGNDTEVWMTQNLVLGHDKGYTLTKDDTNIPDNTTYYLPPAGKRGSVTSSSTVTATNTATFDTSNVSEAHVQYRAAGQAGDQSSTGTLFQNTGYYNYPAATLGYSYYDDGLSSGNSPRDICPKGWQLPRSSSTSTYSFYWLDRALGGTGANRTDITTRGKFLNDASFGYSGLYSSSQLYDVGSYGRWWSSTLYSSAYAYSMRLDSGGGVYPQSYNNKCYGFSVRCVAK